MQQRCVIRLSLGYMARVIYSKATNLPVKHIGIGGCGFCVSEGNGTSVIWCVMETQTEVELSVCSLLLYVKFAHSFI